MKKIIIGLLILFVSLLTGCFYQASTTDNDIEKPVSHLRSYLNWMVEDCRGNSYKINKVTKKENYIYLSGCFTFVDFRYLTDMVLIVPKTKPVRINIEQTKKFNSLNDSVEKINYEGEFVLVFNDECIDYNTTDILLFDLNICQKGITETFLCVKKSEIENIQEGVNENEEGNLST